MKKSIMVAFLFLLVGSLALAACGGGTGTDEVVVPAQYAGMTNPHTGDPAAAEAGRTIYTANCASCHGDTGKGDGPAGAALDPKAADLTASNDKADDYLHWRIAEGGMMEPFNSSMPAWKGILSEDDIWNTVTYIDTLQ